MNDLINIITDQVEKFIKNEKIDIEALKGNIVVINNSFGLRTNRARTKKSLKYLAYHFDGKKEFISDNITILENVNLNSDYRILKNFSNIINLDLKTELKKEIDDIGLIIFVLIGELGKIDEISSPFTTDDIDSLIYNPNFKESVKKVGSQVYFNSIQSIEPLIEYFNKNYPNNDLTSKIRSAYANIQKNVFQEMKIPNVLTSDKIYFIDTIVEALENNIKQYEAMLRDDNEYSEKELETLLRISYNFCNDLLIFLKLIFQIIDIKPILGWCLLNDYYSFNKSISGLPMKRYGLKGELDEYIMIVNNARNRYFHKVLPFNTMLEVPLPEQSIKSPKLRLMSHFTSNMNEFQYKDKELVELFLSLKSTNEERISDDFWAMNLNVMNSGLSFLRNTSGALKKLFTLTNINHS